MVKVPRGTIQLCDAARLLSELGFDPALPCWHGHITGLWNKLDGKTHAGFYHMEYIGFPIDGEPEADARHPAITANIDGTKTWLRLIWLAVGPHRSGHNVGKPHRMRVEGRFPASTDPAIGRPIFTIVDIGDVSKGADWLHMIDDARLAFSVVHGVVIGRGRPKGTGQSVTWEKVLELRQQGYTVEEMAEEFGLSRRQMFERLKQLRADHPEYTLPPLPRRE